MRAGASGPYTGTYLPTMEILRDALPVVSEHAQVLLMELHRAPTPQQCEWVLIELQSVFQLLGQLRESLIRDGMQSENSCSQ